MSRNSLPQHDDDRLDSIKARLEGLDLDALTYLVLIAYKMGIEDGVVSDNERCELAGQLLHEGRDIPGWLLAERDVAPFQFSILMGMPGNPIAMGLARRLRRLNEEAPEKKHQVLEAFEEALPGLTGDDLQATADEPVHSPVSSFEDLDGGHACAVSWSTLSVMPRLMRAPSVF